MSNLRLVFFDLGGVVCHFLPARRLAAFAAITRLKAEEIQDKLWDSGFSAQCDAGRYYCVTWVLAEWGRSPGLGMVHAGRSSGDEGERPGEQQPQTGGGAGSTTDPNEPSISLSGEPPGSMLSAPLHHS